MAVLTLVYNARVHVEVDTTAGTVSKPAIDTASLSGPRHALHPASGRAVEIPFMALADVSAQQARALWTAIQQAEAARSGWTDWL